MSVAEYLSNFYEHMEHTIKLASEGNDEPKKKYKMWYNRSSWVVCAGSCAWGYSSKLEDAYHGPYAILEQVSPVTHKMNVNVDGKQGHIIHANFLRNG